MSFPISIVNAVDEVLLSTIPWSLSMDGPAILRMQITLEGHTATASLIFPGGQEKRSTLPLEHPCPGCALRHVGAPLLAPHMEPENYAGALLAMPPGTDSPAACYTLEELTNPGQPLAGARQSAHVALANLDTLVADIFTPQLISERNAGSKDSRGIGEVLAPQLTHADFILTTGTDKQGQELLEHIRTADSHWCPDAYQIGSLEILNSHHDCDGAIDRIHPVTTQAWGGPTEAGFYSFQLESSRAVHPDRLLQNLEKIGACGGYIRGCFWVPTRPYTIGAWGGSGTHLSLAAAGQWEEENQTRLIITTKVESDHLNEVEEKLHYLFEEMLLEYEGESNSINFLSKNSSPSESGSHLNAISEKWLGVDDGLQSFLG